MGQYYAVVNIDKRESLYPLRDFAMFQKLMETSYVGNEMLIAVGDLLAGRWSGDRIIWSGDYAEAEDEPFHDFADYNGLNPFHYELPSPPLDPEHERTTRYFVNLDKGMYVDLEDVTVDTEGFRVHPLALLLATSNGKGNGDYGNRPGQAFVGSWKGDHIRAYEDEATFEVDCDEHDWERIVPGFTNDVPPLPPGLTYKESSVGEPYIKHYDIWYKGNLINHITHGSADTTLITPFTTSREHDYYLPTQYVVIDALRAGVDKLRLEGVKRWVAQWNEIPTEAVTFLARNLEYEKLTGDEDTQNTSELVEWGEMWTFKNHTDDVWALKNPDAFERAGISLFEVEKIGLVFGVDGGGYSFYEDHFLPLYIERGFRWHPVDPELERALEGWCPVEA